MSKKTSDLQLSFKMLKEIICIYFVCLVTQSCLTLL